MQNQTVYLKDYTKAAYDVRSIALVFDLHETHALVTNTMQLKRLSDEPLSLNGEALMLEQVSLDGVLLDTSHYELNASQLILKNCPNEFTLTIITRIEPQKNTALSGLYRSKNIFCTQCEAEGFRRMTYYLDRPDVLSVYTTTIIADSEKYPVLLSNGNLVDEGLAEEGRHWVTWHDPFKKPAYLFALVAGKLDVLQDTFTTQSGKHVDLYLYVEPGELDKTHHAMRSLKAAMRWDEERFGLLYDLERYMIVAVSDFNMGAMENKGLNIFNTQCVLGSPNVTTDDDYAHIEKVVGHEYFHNWTGNRVTCRDWFQLSLKEGLTVFRDQSFSGDMNSRDVERISDVKFLRQAQFPEDAGKMAHPVRPSEYQEIDNFYTATVYHKGAEIIRMFETLLGVAGFRRGMDLYIKRHDGSAATVEDFVSALADANEVNLEQFLNWYTEVGTPRVTVLERSEHPGKLVLRMKQSGAEKPLPIPLKTALFNSDGLLMETLLLLDKPEQTFELTCDTKKPVYVSLLRGFSAPVILEENMSDDELIALLKLETDGFSKWEAVGKITKHHLLKTYAANTHQNEPMHAAPLCLVDALQEVLQDNQLDMALRALLITPPSFEEVVSDIKQLDVALIETVRHAYRAALGDTLWDNCFEIYQSLWAREDHSMQGEAYGRRSLRNICLSLMMCARPSAAYDLCLTQFNQAQTMTDRIASFHLLLDMKDESIRKTAIDAFYAEWKDEELALNKWFACQAVSNVGSASEIRLLLEHPAFDITNPNMVRSVLASFCLHNPKHFHALDGEGYALLRDQIIRIDAINTHMAAGLVKPFTRWQRYDEPRQRLMKAALRVLSEQKLSRGTREMVEKSLS